MPLLWLAITREVLRKPRQRNARRLWALSERIAKLARFVDPHRPLSKRNRLGVNDLFVLPESFDKCADLLRPDRR